MAASKSREGSTGLQPCKPRDGIVLAGYPFFRHTNPGSAGTRIPGQHTASKPGFVRSVGNGPCVCVLGTLCGHKEVVHDTTMRASSTTFEARAVDNQIQLTISQYFMACANIAPRPPPPYPRDSLRSAPTSSQFHPHSILPYPAAPYCAAGSSPPWLEPPEERQQPRSLDAARKEQASRSRQHRLHSRSCPLPLPQQC